MAKHDDAYQAREAARTDMIAATVKVTQLRRELQKWERDLAQCRDKFLDADRMFQQLLAADGAGVLGNVAQVTNAGSKPT